MPCRLALLSFALVVLRGAAAAHPLAPVLLELRDLGGGRVAVTWKTPLRQPRGGEAVPVLPTACTGLDAPTTSRETAGIVTRWTARCDDLIGARVGIDGLTPPLTGLVRVELLDGRTVRAVVAAGREFVTVPARPRRRDVAGGYLRVGIEHILGGPDHLLFVAGLVLLAGTGRRILGMVSAFTVGHSLTLTAAVLGLLVAPARVVELAIAGSVLALAVELARPTAGRSMLRARPWTIACGFGLLHGLGFAGALRDAGLPAGEVPLALLAFNGGIELGQLAFVAGLLIIGRGVSPLAKLSPTWSRMAPAYVLGACAAYWCFERAAAWWR